MLDQVVDALFVFDLLQTCRTSYVDKTGREITDGGSILRHYLRTWFSIDFIAIVPFEYIFVILGLQANLALLSFLKARAGAVVAACALQELPPRVLTGAARRRRACCAWAGCCGSWKR